MGFPSFRGAVRTLVLINAGIFVALLLMRSLYFPGFVNALAWGKLSTEGIKQGWVWQFLTYGFLHLDPFNFLLSMLGIYFIGTAVESRIGARAFVELYLTSLVGAGVVGWVLSLTGQIGLGAAIGSGPAANAVLMVFYMLYRDAKVSPMFIPIPIPVKWIVIFTAAVETAYLLLSRFSLAMMVLLLGLGAGYLWYRVLWRHSFLLIMQDGIANLRNNYFRWKRRRAARKFEVYMRKHQDDPKKYFDEYGNFKPPSEKDKGERGPGGWVN